MTPRNSSWLFLVAPLIGALITIGSLTSGSEAQNQDPRPKPLVGHTDEVRSVVYSPNQRYLVTGSADQTIRIWNATTSEEIRSLEGHTGQVLSVTVSPDGDSIVSGAADNTLRIWDLPRPDPLRNFEGHTEPVLAVAVAPNGKWAVSFGDDRTGRVWDLEDGKAMMLLEAHTAEVRSTAVRPDGNQIASGDAEGNLFVWRTLDGNEQGQLGAHVGAILGLAYHPNNQQFITAGQDGALKVWQLPIVGPRSLTGFEEPIRAMALNGDGQLAVAAGDESVRVLNVGSGESARELPDAIGATRAVVVSPNNALVAAVGEAGSVKLWNLGDGADRLLIHGHDAPIHAVQFHPDNARLATAGEDGSIRLWRYPTAPVPLNGHTSEVVSVAISDNGELMATASTDQSIRLWNPTNGQPVRQLSGHTQPLRRIAFRSDHAQLAGADAGGAVRFWNPADGTDQGMIGAHAGPIHGFAYDPTGERLATVGADGTLKVWRLPFTPATSLPGNGEAVQAVAMNADAKLLLTGGADKSIRVYDATNGEQLRALPDVSDGVTSLTLNRDDAITAAGSSNGVIQFWNTSDGSPWKPSPEDPPEALPVSPQLIGHDGPVLDLAFDTEGEFVISAGADGTIRQWRMPSRPRIIRDESGPMTRMVVSPDGKRAAIAGTFQEKPAILLRDLESGKILHGLLGHEGPITCLAFQADGKKLVTGSSDKTARVWDLTDPKFPELCKVSHPSTVTAVALDDDATQLHSAAEDNVIRSWSVSEGEEVRAIPGHGGAVTALMVTGKTLVSGSADSTIRLWDRETGKAIRSINHGAPITSLTISTDGSQLASGSSDNTIKLWNTTDGSAIASLMGHASAIVDVSFNADDTQLVSVANDGIWFWDVIGKRRLETIGWNEFEPRGVGIVPGSVAVGGTDGSIRVITPHLLKWIDAHADGVISLALASEGTRLVSSGADKSVKLWNLDDASEWTSFAGPTEVVARVALTSDGKHLIGGGADRMLRVWSMPEAATDDPIAPIKEWELPAPIRALHLNGDGTRVAIGGEDQQIRLWDLTLGKELEHFTAHTDAVTAVALSTDGQVILSGSIDKTARLSRTSLEQVEGLSDPARNVVFLPEDDRLVTVGDGEVLNIWKTGESGLEIVGEVAVDSKDPTDLAIRPDGKHLAVIDAAGHVVVWDLVENQQAYAIDPVKHDSEDDEAPPVGSLHFNADSTRLVVGYGQQVRVFEAQSGRFLQRIDEPSSVTSVALTPDQQKLLVGRTGESNNAGLEPFLLERVIDAHDEPIHSLAFTPDGNFLASGSDDHTVSLWNVAEGTLRQRLEAGDEAITCVSFTRDASRVVAGDADGELRVWPLDLGMEKPADVPEPTTFTQPAAIHSVSVSADNLKIAISGEDGIVRVLDLASGRELQRFGQGNQPARVVAFSPDNKTLVTGFDVEDEPSGQVFTMNLIRSIDTGPNAINDLALVNNGTQALTADKDGGRHWNLADGNMLRKFETPEDVAMLTVAARNDAQIATADADGQVTLWNLGNGDVVASFEVSKPIRQLRYSPDNQKLVTIGFDDRIRFHTATDGELLSELTSDQPLRGVTFTTDSRTVLTGGAELRQWLYASPTAIRTLTGHGGSVYGVAYSPDGRWIASASADQSVRLWNAETGAQIKQLTGHQGAAYSVAFSPDGALLVSSGAEAGLRLWDTLGGRQLKQIPVGEGGLYSVAYFPDGKRVAAAGVDRKIYFVDVLGGKIENTLEKHPDFLYRLAFNKDGSRLLSSGYSGNIVLWNTTNGKDLFTEELGHVTNFADLAPDGSRIVVAGGDGTAYFLEVPASAK